VWAYARGGDLAKEAETALDTVTYAAQIAAQLGAHIIKVKLPSAHVADKKSKQLLEENGIAIDNLSDRVSYLIRSAFDGRRIVINSGGA
ncbi:MAG: fructose-bisphosphate aldolase, partial [Gammaproteobacteria bacterium]|nr:fructose-bisphosphate aldolase [Gammaproteobacteria bacterium]